MSLPTVRILMCLHYLWRTHTSVRAVKLAYLEHLFAFGRKVQGIHSVYSNWENINIPHNLNLNKSALYCGRDCGGRPRAGWDRASPSEVLRTCDSTDLRARTRFDGPAGSLTVMRITDDTTCCTRRFKLGIVISK